MRFVIQHHKNKDEHFDLMIEIGDSDALLTWKISTRDMDSLLRGIAVKAERIRDHRKDYLDYEGPVSNGRGSVRIFDSGSCRTAQNKDGMFVFELSGGKIRGNITLNKSNGIIFDVRYIAWKMQQ